MILELETDTDVFLETLASDYFTMPDGEKELEKGTLVAMYERGTERVYYRRVQKVVHTLIEGDTVAILQVSPILISKELYV